jgi:hypothetical protein
MDAVSCRSQQRKSCAMELFVRPDPDCSNFWKTYRLERISHNFNV